MECIRRKELSDDENLEEEEEISGIDSDYFLWVKVKLFVVDVLVLSVKCNSEILLSGFFELREDFEVVMIEIMEIDVVG